jgi:hypothetical protein
VWNWAEPPWSAWSRQQARARSPAPLPRQSVRVSAGPDAGFPGPPDLRKQAPCYSRQAALASVSPRSNSTGERCYALGPVASALAHSLEYRARLDPCDGTQPSIAHGLPFGSEANRNHCRPNCPVPAGKRPSLATFGTSAMCQQVSFRRIRNSAVTWPQSSLGLACHAVGNACRELAAKRDRRAVPARGDRLQAPDPQILHRTVSRGYWVSFTSTTTMRGKRCCGCHGQANAALARRVTAIKAKACQSLGIGRSCSN